MPFWNMLLALYEDLSFMPQPNVVHAAIGRTESATAPSLRISGPSAVPTWRARCSARQQAAQRTARMRPTRKTMPSMMPKASSALPGTSLHVVCVCRLQ